MLAATVYLGSNPINTRGFVLGKGVHYGFNLVESGDLGEMSVLIVSNFTMCVLENVGACWGDRRGEAYRVVEICIESVYFFSDAILGDKKSSIVK